MPQRRFKTIMVVGDQHGEIAAKYSADTKVEEYAFANLAGAAARREGLLRAYEYLLSRESFSDATLKDLKPRYFRLSRATDREFFDEIAEGCVVKEDGIAYSTANPEARYKYQSTPSGSAGAAFMKPFVLLDGTSAYSARKGDVDWGRTHMGDAALHARAWELGVEDAEPSTDEEKRLKECTAVQLNYMRQFKSKEDFVNHRSAFWHYVVAMDGGCAEMDSLTDEGEWVAKFYERFVAPLSDDTLLTLYEARALEK